jgi:hypothetical protein
MILSDLRGLAGSPERSSAVRAAARTAALPRNAITPMALRLHNMGDPSRTAEMM